MGSPLDDVQARGGQLSAIVSAAARRHLRVLAVVFGILFVLFSIDVYQRERHAYAVLSFVGMKTFSKTTQSYFPPIKDGCPAGMEADLPPHSTLCANFPKHLLSDIQIVIKTGAAHKDKIHALLQTSAACLDNVMIVSDAPDMVDSREVIDILADLPPSYAEDNPEWAIYLAQLDDLAAGKPVNASNEGKSLDKYKFLPMVDRAYEAAPDAKWFVFIEDDIYYFWDTVFRLLSFMDPNEYHYLGSAAPGTPDTYFAYGGAGIILSRGIVRELTKKGQQKLAVKHEGMVRGDPNGDAVLGYVIKKELGVRVETLYPMLTGEEPEWLGVSSKKWCVPLLGLHRISPQKMTDIWKWERCREYSESPITFSAFLDHTLKPLLDTTPRLNWNNGANDRLPPTTPGNESAHACEMACAAQPDCLQYRFSDEDKCRVSKSINVGVPSGELGLVSDWHLEALEALGYDSAKNPGDYCKKTTWLVPHIM